MLNGQTAYFFILFNIDEYRYESNEMLETILKKLELNSVPILSKDYLLTNNIETLVEQSKIKSALNKDIWAEGIIIRPIETDKYKMVSNNLLNSGRISFKVINPEFLLKFSE